MNDSTVKAVRATIALGDSEFDVYQLPCGKYFLSLTQIAESVAIDKKRLSELRQSKLALSLYPQGFQESEMCRVEGGTKPVSMISLDDVSKYWTLAAFQTQNQLAIAFLAASQSEALERRADAAFGKVRTEQERNERFVVRRDGIVSRHFWTDCIDTYCRSAEVSDNYRKWIYVQVSDMLNKSILGMTAKAYRESMELPEGISTRDYLNAEQLKQIDTIEKAAGMRVNRDGLCPKQALKDVISLIG